MNRVLRMYSLRTRKTGQNEPKAVPETRSTRRRKRHIAPQYETAPEVDSIRIKQEKLDSDSSSAGLRGSTATGFTAEQTKASCVGFERPKQETFDHTHSNHPAKMNFSHPVPLAGHAYQHQGHTHPSVNQLQPYHYRSTPLQTNSPFPSQSWFYITPPSGLISNQPISSSGGETFGGLSRNQPISSSGSASFGGPIQMQPISSGSQSFGGLIHPISSSGGPSFGGIVHPISSSGGPSFGGIIHPISSSGGPSFGGLHPDTRVKLEEVESRCDPVKVKREIEEDLKCDMLRQIGETAGDVKSEQKVKEEVKSEGEKWEPPKWREHLDNIIKMREKRDAPVDWSGCHVLAASDVPPEVRRYQVLVSLMLSSQTKDEIVGQAMRKLKNHGLTVDNILETPLEILAQLILPVGFWNKKSEYIKRTSQILKDKYNSDIPNNMKELTSLPGIGPKMAHLIMDVAWDSVTGIAVDTHVHRISHRLGWIKKPTKNPEVTRAALEDWLPLSEWRELNWLMVGFGQQICRPLRPKCDKCLNKDICPSAFPSPPSTPKRKASSSSASPSPRVKNKTPKTPRVNTKKRSQLQKADPASRLDSNVESVNLHGLGSVPPGVESVAVHGSSSVPDLPTTPHKPVEATRTRLSDSFKALPHRDDTAH